MRPICAERVTNLGRMPTGSNTRSDTRASAPRRRTGISFEDMAARRAERLVNLVICLLSTRQFLTAERIRDAVPGYEAGDGSKATDEAFKRMFERDKAELRELGIPLETGRNSHFDSEDGYRIKRRRVRAAADRVRRRRGGRRRSRQPAVALGDPRRAGPLGADEAPRRRHARPGRCATRRRARSRHERPEPAGADRRRAHSASCEFRLPQVRSGIRTDAHARTLGCVVMAWTLVRRGFRPRPR